MSFESPQQSASAEAARTQSQRASDLWNVTSPQLSSILSRIQSDVSPNGIAPSVQQAFGKARQGIESDYGLAQKGEAAYLPQAFAQAGGVYNRNQLDDAKAQAAQNLDFERRAALKRLDYDESMAGMTQFNSLMNLLGAGAGTALNLSSGFSGAQASAIGGMSNKSPGWGALGGAASGAAMGAQFGGVYGAAAGGILGGLGGYFGSQG